MNTYYTLRYFLHKYQNEILITLPRRTRSKVFIVLLDVKTI